MIPVAVELAVGIEVRVVTHHVLIGAIEPGKFADMIAVDGNVLEDVKQLEHVRFVMKGGAVVRNDYSK